MMKRDELSNPNSCLNQAGDDEWIFVVVAHDPAAAETVRHWMKERLWLGLNLRLDHKILDAERTALAMEG